MQKLLVLLGTITIVGSGIINLTANSNLIANKEGIINKNLSVLQSPESETDEVDWDQVNKYFKDLNKNSSNKTSREKEMFKSVSEFGKKSVKKYQKMGGQLFTNLFDIMINDFRTEFPDFKNLYDKKIQKNEGTMAFSSNSGLNFNNDINVAYSISKDKQAALEYWDKLNDINLGFKTATTIVAIAAAGFWAAAWFFGISVPWTIAATVVAASLGVTTAGISYYLNINNEYQNNLIKSIRVTLSIRTLAHSFWDIVFPILTANVTVVSGTSLIIPAVTAVLATTSAFFAWILRTSIFLEAENNEKNKLKLEEEKLNPKINFKKIGAMSTGGTTDHFNIRLMIILLLKYYYKI
ncbi:hypothetical protein [Spiroplasma poulsonii]|uniref:hypothetical protein n=1 Tax=Spiroplasma poulsonii TaxID=2138 RepID=UPI001F4CDFED|nr:hypothetical protein [Spiroplasma poulsonii]UNF61579.1 hypothetical protein MNU24_06620 [Spiroplasma poulsonii]